MSKPSLLLIGLGNPGKEYTKTRHNAGFLAVEALAKECGAPAFEDKQKFLCVMTEVEIEGKTVLIVKPTTFMNRSGECARKLVDFYKLDPTSQILVCVDDVDIPLGTCRVRVSGGPGTHNGMKSLVDTFGENFPRFRIGIGPQPAEQDLAVWVLSRMTKEEVNSIEKPLSKLLETVRKSLQP